MQSSRPAAALERFKSHVGPTVQQRHRSPEENGGGVGFDDSSYAIVLIEGTAVRRPDKSGVARGKQVWYLPTDQETRQELPVHSARKRQEPRSRQFRALQMRPYKEKPYHNRSLPTPSESPCPTEARSRNLSSRWPCTAHPPQPSLHQEIPPEAVDGSSPGNGVRIRPSGGSS